MNSRSAVFLCTAVFLLAGCTPHSPIDAKKAGARTENGVSKTASAQQLTDKDIFGNETTLAVSEEEIQAALEGNVFRVPLSSPVILVQSGSRAPEAIMQQEMSRYYTVATFSGINLYAYAPNPLSWIDPLGLTTEYKSESPYHGRKPTYDPATHHDPSSPDFRGGGSKTTPLPPDAEEVYRRSVPGDSEGRTWYGQNSEGEFYRYQGQNGKVHWNGREKSARGLKVPQWIRNRFNQMAVKIKRSGGKCG